MVKKMVKIIVLIILLFSIGFIVSVVFTLTGIGNPFVKYKAEHEIKAYIEEYYPGNDFEEIDVIYNFKFGDYTAGVSSASSIDTHFMISYDDGEIRDNYESYVLSGFNTYRRIERKFDQEIESILYEQYPEKIELCLFELQSHDRDIDSAILLKEIVPLDGDLDLSELSQYDFASNLTVWYISDDIDFEILELKFIETKALMDELRILIEMYSIALRYPEETREGRFDEHISIHDIPAELIGADGFVDILQKRYDEGQTTTKKEN